MSRNIVVKYIEKNPTNLTEQVFSSFLHFYDLLLLLKQNAFKMLKGS